MWGALPGLGVVALAVATAGCGEDADRLSAEEFRRQADAICAAANAEIDEAASEVLFSGGEPSDEDVAAFVTERLLPNIREQIADLRALNPPEELEDAVDQLLDDAETMVGVAEEDPGSVFADEDAFADVGRQAAELGLPACADDAQDEGDADDEAAADVEPNPDDPYCDVDAEIEAVFDESFTQLASDATDNERQVATEAAAQRIIDEGLLDEAATQAPEPIREDVEVLLAFVRAHAAGDVEASFDQDEDAAGARVAAYCGSE